MSDEEAAETLLEGLDSAPLADPRPVRFRPGRRIEAWRKNVVAIGLSGGFLEPLESTSIHLIQTAVHRLLALFPARGFHQADIDEFNLQTKLEYEDIRDFIIAHYKVTRRRGEPFWDYVREMKIPDSLARRIALFESSARFFGHSKLELFAEESWVQVLLGQGLDARVDPVTQFVDDEDLAVYLRDTADTIAEQAAQMPDHGAFIARLPDREARLEGAITAPIKRG
jgi:tryptophan halogenase